MRTGDAPPRRPEPSGRSAVEELHACRGTRRAVARTGDQRLTTGLFRKDKTLYDWKHGGKEETGRHPNPAQGAEIDAGFAGHAA